MRASLSSRWPPSPCSFCVSFWNSRLRSEKTLAPRTPRGETVSAARGGVEQRCVANIESRCISEICDADVLCDARNCGRRGRREGEGAARWRCVTRRRRRRRAASGGAHHVQRERLQPVEQLRRRPPGAQSMTGRPAWRRNSASTLPPAELICARYSAGWRRKSSGGGCVTRCSKSGRWRRRRGGSAAAWLRVAVQVLDVGADAVRRVRRRVELADAHRAGAEAEGGAAPRSERRRRRRGAGGGQQGAAPSTSTTGCVANMKCAKEWKPPLALSTCLYCAGYLRFRSRIRSTDWPSPRSTSARSRCGIHVVHVGVAQWTMRTMSRYDFVSVFSSGGRKSTGVGPPGSCGGRPTSART